MEAQGGSIADKLVESYLDGTVSWKPQIWFTYHVYYKAPDWIGLKVTEKINNLGYKCYDTQDFKIGYQSFLNKTKPKFKNK